MGLDNGATVGDITSETLFILHENQGTYLN